MPEKIDENNPINTLHKYFIWANRMRTHFDEALSFSVNNKIDTKAKNKKFEIEADMYMSLWYGLLYVVIEGWRELKLHDEKIDLLISDKNTELLRKYRNGAFHFNKIDNNTRFQKFFEEQSTVQWTRGLNKEFSRWFLDYYKKLNSK